MKKIIISIAVFSFLTLMSGCGCGKESLKEITINVTNENQLRYQYGSDGSQKMVVDEDTTIYLSASYSPKLDDVKLKCYSSDENVAKVEDKKVIPIKEGTTSIYCIADNITSNQIEIVVVEE